MLIFLFGRCQILQKFIISYLQYCAQKSNNLPMRIARSEAWEVNSVEQWLWLAKTFRVYLERTELVCCLTGYSARDCWLRCATCTQLLTLRIYPAVSKELRTVSLAMLVNWWMPQRQYEPYGRPHGFLSVECDLSRLIHSAHARRRKTKRNELKACAFAILQLYWRPYLQCP